jgi:polar amino acid transport system substrate-binding protein
MEENMKNFVTLSAAILAMTLLLIVASCGKKQDAAKPAGTSGTAALVTVYAATAGMPRPFTYVDESGQIVGHNIELIKAIFAKLPQYELRFDVTDFPSIFSGLDSGRYQIGVNNFGMNETRKQKYIYSAPIFSTRTVVVLSPKVKIYAEKINLLEELAGLTTVNSPGNWASTLLENYNTAHPDKKIIMYYSDADTLVQVQEVESGKYDFVLLDKPLYDIYSKEYSLIAKAVEMTDELRVALADIPYTYMLFGKEQEKLAAEVGAVLEQLVKDGTSKAINLKYFRDDYSPYDYFNQ